MRTAALLTGLLTLLTGMALSQAQTFQPCAQSQQQLAPEQVHLVNMCQSTPESRPVLSLLLSEKGIDVYRMTSPAATAKPKSAISRYPFTVRALLVYQDDSSRKSELKMLTDSHAVQWLGGFDTQTGHQEDWGSIVSAKYETVEFVWLSKENVILRHMGVYAPPECITPVHNAITRHRGNGLSCGSPDIASNEVGSYNNISPPPLSHDAFLYRVASLLADPPAAP